MRLLVKRHNYAPEEEELDSLDGFEPFDFEGKQAYRETEHSNVCNCINKGEIECAVIAFDIGDMGDDEIANLIEFIDERSCMAITMNEMAGGM